MASSSAKLSSEGGSEACVSFAMTFGKRPRELDGSGGGKGACGATEWVKLSLQRAVRFSRLETQLRDGLAGGGVLRKPSWRSIQEEQGTQVHRFKA